MNKNQKKIVTYVRCKFFEVNLFSFICFWYVDSSFYPPELYRTHDDCRIQIGLIMVKIPEFCPSFRILSMLDTCS